MTGPAWKAPRPVRSSRTKTSATNVPASQTTRIAATPRSDPRPAHSRTRRRTASRARSRSARRSRRGLGARRRRRARRSASAGAAAAGGRGCRPVRVRRRRGRPTGRGSGERRVVVTDRLRGIERGERHVRVGRNGRRDAPMTCQPVGTHRGTGPPRHHGPRAWRVSPGPQRVGRQATHPTSWRAVAGRGRASRGVPRIDSRAGRPMSDGSTRGRAKSRPLRRAGVPGGSGTRRTGRWCGCGGSLWLGHAGAADQARQAAVGEFDP